jgi:nucleoside-diphosphate-sugar epimerase
MENIFKKFIYTEIDEIYNSTKYKFLKNKEILITGATGLLGQYFVAFFLKASEGKNKPKNITLLHKSEIPEYLNFLKKNKSFKLRKINLAEKKFSSTKKYDYIIHLATYGQPKKFLDESLKTFFLNTSLMEDLILRLKNKGIFLFLSTSEIYFGLKNKPKEDSIGKINTNMNRAAYIFSKLSGETFLNIYKRKHSLNFKSIRLCSAFGPGNKKDDSRVIYELIKKGLITKKISLQDNGSALRSYVYILDAIKMIINIMFFGKHNTYNVGGKNLISIKKLGLSISKILKCSFKNSKNKKKNFSAPQLASVNTELYKKEFGPPDYKSFNKCLKKTIEWQKTLY